jgi:ketosteroid isomerase-like protein
MADGDLDAVLDVYDREAVFVHQSGEVTKGWDALHGALAPLVAARTCFDFTIKAVVEAGDIALMHTRWTVSGDRPMNVHAIEVARRQPDGSWKWLIGDPYTIGRVSMAVWTA